MRQATLQNNSSHVKLKPAKVWFSLVELLPSVEFANKKKPLVTQWILAAYDSRRLRTHLSLDQSLHKIAKMLDRWNI
jgi:hypothetical protein